MNITIRPGQRSGRVKIPASKSQAHRLLICAALGQGETLIACDGLSADITATMACLNALGADIRQTEDGRLRVRPIEQVPAGLCHLYCGESGSTLRFLLPVCGALGADAVFHMEGRLPQRPLDPFDAVLKEHGMTLEQEGSLLRCGGRLRAVSPVRTAPYPGFPTDAQALLMAALLRSEGATMFVENMFESRYRHVPELLRMGAEIRLEGRVAVVCGVTDLHGAAVRSADLRGGAALVIGGLQARGVTQIHNIHHIQRGYQDIAGDLAALGAEVSTAEL